MKTLTSRLSALIASARSWLNTGRGPYIFTAVYLALTSLFVYLDSQSLVAFLLFLGSAWFIYKLPTRPTFKLILALILALGVIPVIGSKNIFYFEVIFQVCVFSALALGLNIVVGFAGLLNLGYVAFYAVGAYLWAFFGSQQAFLLNSIPGSAPLNTPFLLPADAFYLFLFLGMGLAAVVGILLGLPVLRVRGDYLAIVTLGFGEVIRVLANNLDKPVNLTNGPQGITPVQRPTLPGEVQGVLNALLSPLVGRPLGEGEFYNLFFYLIALLIILMVIFIVRRLDDSKTGRAWAAVREDELAAASMGIPVVRYKLAAFAVGASFAGIMGVLFAASRTFVSPESFNFMQSIGVLSMVILGGLGSIPGVIVGSAVVVVLNTQVLQSLSLYLNSLRQSNDVIPIINFAWRDLSSQLDPAKYQRMLFGLILIVMMIYRQEGLIPAQRRLRNEDQNGPAVEENGDSQGNGRSTEVTHGAA
jgi:branched-chain amino acid transport system permease protein